MDIENLEERKLYKDFPKLCEQLGIKPRGGNSKLAQLKELEQYCKYTRIGNGFWIEKIYTKNNVLKKVDNRINIETDTMKDLIGLLLLDRIYQQGVENNLCFPKTYFYKMLEMVNDNYHNEECDKLMMEKHSLFDVTNFYGRSAKRLWDMLNGALKRLETQSTIMFSDKEIEIQIVDKAGNLIRRIANKEEKEKYIKTQKEILIEFRVKDTHEIFLQHKAKKFYKRLDDELYKLYGWNHCISVVQIIFNRDKLPKEIEIKENILKEHLNSLVFKKILQNTRNSFKNNRKKMIGFKNQEKPFQFQDNFIEVQDELAQYYILIERE